jgi:hypothetical protein
MLGPYLRPLFEGRAEDTDAAKLRGTLIGFVVNSGLLAVLRF